MTKACNLAALLALTGIAALPACSMFTGDDHGTRTSNSAGATSQSYAAAPNYSPPPPTTPQRTEMSPDTIRGVQQNLKQAGLYRGRVDGVWGPATEAGVRNFQQQHNLNATGQLDQDTLTAMNLGNGANQQPAQHSSNYNPPPDSNAQPGSTSSDPR
jgi:peptidoglycan hydrolase-like protein with peptidoglycan-binding domain